MSQKQNPDPKVVQMEKIKIKQWDLRTKAWLELEGHPVIGAGRMAMLQAIEHRGSILRASQELGISYRKMRGAIRDMEDIIGEPLVKAYRGGGNGGGAELTPAAQELMAFFNKFSKEFNKKADTHFQRILK